MANRSACERVAFYCLKATRWIDNLIDVCPLPADKQKFLDIRDQLARLYGRYHWLSRHEKRGTHERTRQT